MDVFTKEKRSEIMSGVRSKWTSHERIVHGILKSRKIRHRMHPKMTGNPDILLKDTSMVVFLDGCFWHGCPRCYREPQSNRNYWIPKIEANKRRDRKHTRFLRKEGYRVVRVWEHTLTKNSSSILNKI